MVEGYQDYYFEGTLWWKCKAKLCLPGQYFMIILSWNFVLSMIGQYNNVMLWTIYHSETVS